MRADRRLAPLPRGAAACPSQNDPHIASPHTTLLQALLLLSSSARELQGPAFTGHWEGLWDGFDVSRVQKTLSAVLPQQAKHAHHSSATWRPRTCTLMVCCSWSWHSASHPLPASALSSLRSPKDHVTSPVHTRRLQVLFVPIFAPPPAWGPPHRAGGKGGAAHHDTHRLVLDIHQPC